MIKDPASLFQVAAPFPFPLIVEPTWRRIRDGAPRIVGRLARPDMLVTVGFRGPVNSDLPPSGRRVILLTGRVTKSEAISRDAVAQYEADPRSWHVELDQVEWSVLGDVYSKENPFRANFGT